jgi:4-carboxymuconolactone decarboxylase
MRIPVASRDSVPQQYLEAFDEMVGIRGGIPQTGPIAVLLNSPGLCRLVWQIIDFLWNRSSLPKHIQELGMLVTARELDCQYIWNAHAPTARQAGLSDDLVDALRDEEALPPLQPDEAVVVQYGQEFYRTHHVSRGTFQEALEVFGTQGLTELTTLLGFYGMLAFNIIAFDVPLPDERSEPIMPV